MSAPAVVSNGKRLGPTRSLTWPLTATTTTRVDGEHIFDVPRIAALASAPSPPNPPPIAFEDDLNSHPENHYLSPIHMYEYEDWADDDDDEDDADEVEWNAGITDFTLYDSDRRHAEEQRESVPTRWRGLIASQASALQRAEQRNRAITPVGSLFPDDDELPHLTPDTSPHMRDDLESDPEHDDRRGDAPRSKHVPIFEITPPPEDYHRSAKMRHYFDDDDDDSASDSEDDDDDVVPIALLLQRGRERALARTRNLRPGLRSTRTLSGRAHVWRRPSRDISVVAENVEAEVKAEEAEMEQMR